MRVRELWLLMAVLLKIRLVYGVIIAEVGWDDKG